MPGSSEEKLKGSVSTGQDNVLTAKPYAVTDLKAKPPDRWDPSKETLPISYKINDPNGRIKSGRILYLVRGKEDWLLAHKKSLNLSLLKHGDHKLPKNEEWDGKITETKITRYGQQVQRVTADLAKFRVVVQVWNKESEAPGKLPPHQWEGKTDNQGEWVSHDKCYVEIDAVVKCKWSREWVIPYVNDAEDERDKGSAQMDIQTKNVLDGTPVFFEIDRIEEINKPDSDTPYIDTVNSDEESQPGLHGATVKNGKILLKDESLPYVRFNNFEEHWKKPGLAFYCLRLRFEDGDLINASERDYKSKEKDCLLMKFSVFVQIDPRYTKETGDDLHRLFGETKYYYSYLMGDPKDPEDWANHFKYRYMVILVGHAASGCMDKKHPRNPKTKEFKEIPNKYFKPPDQYVCPKDVPQGYSRNQYGGCGSKTHVYQRIWLGKSGERHPQDKGQKPQPEIWLRCDNLPIGDSPGRLRIFKQERVWRQVIDKKTGKKEWKSKRGKVLWEKIYDFSDSVPRFIFWNGGCQTILTTSFGERIVKAGTRYYHGWIYTVRIDHAHQLPTEVFRRWIKGSLYDKPPNEYDPERFLRVYQEEAQRIFHDHRYPRIMDQSGILNRTDPAAAEKSLKDLYSAKEEMPPDHLPP